MTTRKLDLDLNPCGFVASILVGVLLGIIVSGLAHGRSWVRILRNEVPPCSDIFASAWLQHCYEDAAFRGPR